MLQLEGVARDPEDSHNRHPLWTLAVDALVVEPRTTTTTMSNPREEVAKNADPEDTRWGFGAFLGVKNDFRVLSRILLFGPF